MGVFCVMMFGMLILGRKKSQRLWSTPVKTKLMLLSYFCLDRFLKFGEKWLFSYFYSIFKHNKRFLNNIMILRNILKNEISTLSQHLVNIWPTPVGFKEVVRGTNHRYQDHFMRNIAAQSGRKIVPHNIIYIKLTFTGNFLKTHKC